jgi:hypothetical protein
MQYWKKRQSVMVPRALQNRRRLRVEQFEARRLLAVSAVIDRDANGDHLIINGDSANDQIAIVGTANPGEFLISGVNGTLINGAASATLGGVSGSIVFDLGGGDDNVTMDNVLVARDIIFEDSGGGNDTIVLGNAGVVSTGRNLEIGTGDGDDSVSMLNYNVLIGDNIYLDTAEGNDSLRLDGASAAADIQIADDTEGADGANSYTCLITGVTSGANLGVYGDAGTSSVAVINTSALWYLYVQMEEGANTIYVDTCYSAGYITLSAGEYETPGTGVAVNPAYNSSINVFRCACLGLQVYGGNGNDILNVQGNLITQQPPFAGQPEELIVLYIESGVGNDVVTGRYNVVHNITTAQLSDGNDSLTLVGNVVTSTAALNGGLGGNSLLLSGNVFGSLLTANFV